MMFHRAGTNRSDRPRRAVNHVYTLPFMENGTSLAARLAQGWQVNGVIGAYSGTPFTVSATNTALNCPGCGSITVNYAGDAEPTGEAGANGQPYYTVANFSQPTTADVAGFGATGARWERPAATEADRRRDEAECVAQANRDRSVPAQRITSRPGGRTTESIELVTVRDFDTGAFDECMWTRGYRKVPANPPV
jgi:hypothetical protein